MCRRVFEEINQRGGVKTAAVEASFLEIYRENVKDLFSENASNGKKKRGSSATKGEGSGSF